MSLERWLNLGWLTEHQTSFQEIGDLLALVGRDLGDCRTSGLSADWRLAIAYNAALQAAKAALAACGYRASRESHHYRVIHSLELTLNAESDLVDQLDMFRRKRNAIEYDRAGMVSEQEVEEMIAVATEVEDRVKSWLRRNHPSLLEE